MLLFDCKSGVKGGANFLGFWRCFYWWLLMLSCLQFLPHSCISSLVSRDLVPSFSLNFIISICVADYVSLSGMENFLNHFIYSSLVNRIMVQQISRKWWYESIRKCWFAYCLCRFTCKTNGKPCCCWWWTWKFRRINLNLLLKKINLIRKRK